MTTALAIRDLCVEVEEKELLRQINLTIPAGEVHALLGPNGCGKSTLLMTIMGYSQYQVTHGQICVVGTEITGWDITARARLGIGVAHQRPPTIAGVTLRHLLDSVVQKGICSRAELDGLLESFHMQPFVHRSINAGLSGGEIKRSELFQLLITQPYFAMLDEPDSGIDLESLAVVGSMINALIAMPAGHLLPRRSALLITHTGDILDYVPVDRAHVMLDGRIVCAGNPQLIIDEIRRSGFEGCVRCLQQMKEVRP